MDITSSENVSDTVIKIQALVNIIDNVATAITEKNPVALIKAGLYVVEEYCHFSTKKDFKYILKNYVNISNDGTTRLGNIYNNLFKNSIYKKKIGDYSGDILSYTKMGNIDVLIESSDAYIRGVYIKKENVNNFKQELKKYIYSKCNSDFILLGNEGGGKDYSPNNVDILPDTNADPLPSKKAKEIIDYLKTCMNININRNILFYGPPWTGKSSMVKYIVSGLNLKSVRVTYDMIYSQQISNLVFLLNTLGADVLIIDDIDRCTGGEKLIDLIDSIKSNVKFVFATANVVDKINDALLRPGRFDEFHCIDKIDDCVIKSIFTKTLGELDDNLFEKIKHLPIAYINELNCRMKLMPLDQAISSVDELISRAKKLSNKSNNDDDDDDELEDVGDD